MCPKCWSQRIAPTEVSGRGKVQWFTLLYQGVRGASPDAPLPVAVVELEEQEGLRVDATIVECEPSAIASDDALELTWTGTEDAPIPAFRPRR